MIKTFLVAAALQERGDDAAALPLIHHATELYPSNSAPHYRLSDLRFIVFFRVSGDLPCKFGCVKLLDVSFGDRCQLIQGDNSQVARCEANENALVPVLYDHGGDCVLRVDLGSNAYYGSGLCHKISSLVPNYECLAYFG